MMTDAVPLDTFGSVVLDANGDGTIRLAPTGEKWEIRRSHVECSSRVNEAKCVFYARQVAPRYVVDGTYSGSSGDNSDTPIYLEDGQALFVVWEDGDPGATATVTLSGWRSAPMGGFRAIH